ncbi:hypothetical protein AMECASPLE_037848, partial [Ameca splendens]
EGGGNAQFCCLPTNRQYKAGRRRRRKRWRRTFSGCFSDSVDGERQSSSRGMDVPVVVTVRLIRSFERRNYKPVVFQQVSLEQTAQDFMRCVRDDIATRPGLPPPFREYGY